eukprot:Ihof_evm7s198 gene=Ihof_evmTU7s198
MAWRQKGKFTMNFGAHKKGVSGFQEVGSAEGAKRASSTPDRPINRRMKLAEEDNYLEQEEEAEKQVEIERPIASDESEDELDAYMANIAKEADRAGGGDGPKVKRTEYEDEDDQDTFFKHLQKVKAEEAARQIADDEEVLYDSDDNPIVNTDKREILPLPDIDHSAIDYLPFEKDFYIEHEDIKRLTDEQVRDLQLKFQMKVSGYCPPRPCLSFAHFGFDEALMALIRKMEFTQPTPIQAQGIACALAGRDVIGIAKTGSGKTAAYLWPMMVHIMDQPELEPEDGPIGLVCAPTRELAQQIYTEARRYGKAYGLRIAAVYGGDSKWDQTKALRDGAEIVVATPGRLIDMVKTKAVKMDRITFLVLDEADRMFDMGFEPQVKSIVNNTRPDRQTLLFSATFKKKVERLARSALTDPVRIVIGDVGEANQDVTQHVEIFRDIKDKWPWLVDRLVQFTSAGSVLIFVGRKDNCTELAKNLGNANFEVGCLHGNVDQSGRNEIINNFKKKKMPILVATDVAARGLDIPSIRTVINYDMSRDIDTHTHRIGRTGRAGMKGEAYTLITEKDERFASELVRSMEGANQIIPPSLLDLANRNPKFRKDRHRGAPGRGGRGRGGRGRGGSRGDDRGQASGFSGGQSGGYHANPEKWRAGVGASGLPATTSRGGWAGDWWECVETIGTRGGD